MRQGQLVGYVGGDNKGPHDGVGQIIDLDGRSAHVLWKSGSRAGDIDLYPIEDLAEPHHASFHQQLDDSLDYGVMDDHEVTASVNNSLDYDSVDLSREAVYEAGERAWRAALESVESSTLFAEASDEMSHHHSSLVRKSLALRGMKDFIRRAEEQ